MPLRLVPTKDCTACRHQRIIRITPHRTARHHCMSSSPDAMDSVSWSGLAIAIASLLVSAFAVYYARLQVNLSIQPLLALEYQQKCGSWTVAVARASNPPPDNGSFAPLATEVREGKLSMWCIHNVGNGPANNVLVRQRAKKKTMKKQLRVEAAASTSVSITSSADPRNDQMHDPCALEHEYEWKDPILLRSIPAGGTFSLFWINPFDTEAIECQYDELFSGRRWQSSMQNDRLSVRRIGSGSRWPWQLPNESAAASVHRKFYRQMLFVPLERHFSRMQQDWEFGSTTYG